MSNEAAAVTSDIRRKAMDAYRQAVISAAEGATPNVSELRETLWIVGRGLDAFEADVATASKRREAAADLGEAERLKADVAAAATNLADVTAKAEEVARRFQEEIKPLLQRQVELQDAVRRDKSRATDLRCRAIEALLRTADAELLARIQELDKERSNALQAYNATTSRYGDWSPARDGELRRLEEVSASHFKITENDVAQLRHLRAAKAAQSQRVELRERMEQRESDIEALRREALDWTKTRIAE